jgi:hypothetical protein
MQLLLVVVPLVTLAVLAVEADGVGVLLKVGLLQHQTLLLVLVELAQVDKAALANMVTLLQQMPQVLQ